MKRVLYIQNSESDGPGLFARTLAECRVALEVVHAWAGEPTPADLLPFDGLALGGGSMSTYESEQFPFLRQELTLIHQARAARKPVLGMCLGAQLLATALGGSVFPNHTKEIGFYDITFTPEAESDPLWRGLTLPFKPVHWHGDTFSLPPGATLLAASKITANQLFRAGPSLYGFQFHLEFDLPMLTEMIRTDSDYLSNHGVDPGIFLSQAHATLPGVESLARTIFERWVTLLN